ncbi:hypothetical protein K8942_04100 [Candidatus Peribacteria bacterium]|nr:MAG: hypothetical protein K8942_04100 [Candidatus Peribacteria bacterium]
MNTPENRHDPLSKRLGIKPGHTVVLHNVPTTVFGTLGSEARQALLQQTPGKGADMLITFQTDAKELDETFDSLKGQIATHGALWIAWPKIIMGIKTDLKSAVVRNIAKKHGLSEVNNTEIEYSYAALKFVYKVQDR